MANPAASFTVKTGGTRLMLSASPTVYTSATLTTPVTFPVVTDQDVTYWVPNRTRVMLSAKLPDGTELAGGHLNVADGVTNAFTPAADRAALAVATSRFAYIAQGTLVTGNYYLCNGQASPGTSAVLGNGILRLCPWQVPNAVTLTKIGAEVTAVGQAASTVRLGIYADNGYGQPASLILDAGTIAGDAVGVQELTISQPLAPGLYWVGAAIQGAGTTQPTVRVPGTGYTPTINVAQNAIPGSAASWIGYQQVAGVPGALPATLSALSVVGTAPRIFVKV